MCIYIYAITNPLHIATRQDKSVYIYSIYTLYTLGQYAIRGREYGTAAAAARLSRGAAYRLAAPARAMCVRFLRSIKCDLASRRVYSIVSFYNGQSNGRSHPTSSWPHTHTHTSCGVRKKCLMPTKIFVYYYIIYIAIYNYL